MTREDAINRLKRWLKYNPNASDDAKERARRLLDEATRDGDNSDADFHVSCYKSIAYMDALVYKFQDLLPIFKQHLSENMGCIRPYSLISDVGLWLEERVAQRGIGDPLVRSILDELERAFAANALDEQSGNAELIAVSILEHLPVPNAAGGEIVTKLGPRILAQHKRIFPTFHSQGLFNRSRE